MSDEEAAGGGKKKSPLLIIIAVLVALLLAGGGGAVYFLVIKKPEPAAEHGAAGEAGKPEGAGAKSATTLGETVELPPFIVNLVGEGGRYVKVVMVLQVSSAATKEELTNRAPQVKDSVIGVLSSKTPDEVLTPEGKLELKLELVKRINQAITSGVVTEMFFTEFVVQ